MADWERMGKPGQRKWELLFLTRTLAEDSVRCSQLMELCSATCGLCDLLQVTQRL